MSMNISSKIENKLDELCLKHTTYPKIKSPCDTDRVNNSELKNLYYLLA